MTRPPLSFKNAPVLSRRLARANERGAALFVVVLLITMLLGIGTYAARSATLATTVAGSPLSSRAGLSTKQNGTTYMAVPRRMAWIPMRVWLTFAIGAAAKAASATGGVMNDTMPQ